MKSTPAAPTVCPGCDGPKSKRAALCAECRRKATAVGVSVVTHVHDAAAPTARLRSSHQSVVFHAKVRDLALAERGAEQELRTVERSVKRRALEQAASMFGRPLESSTELTEIEMDRLCEWLDQELDKQ